MVTRKPVPARQPGAATTSSSSLPSQPPIPPTPTVIAPTPITSPTSASAIPIAAPSHAPPPPPPPPPQEEHTTALPLHNKKHDTPADSEDDDEEEEDWDKSDSEDEWEMADDEERKLTPDADIPAPLRISRPPSQELDKGKARERGKDDIPAALRVGPAGGVPPHVSQESLSNTTAMDGGVSNNPWRSVGPSPPAADPPVQNPFMLKPQNTGEALFGSQNSSGVWSGASSSPPSHQHAQQGPIAELSANMSPTDEYRRNEVSELPSTSSPVERRNNPLLPVGAWAQDTQQMRPVSVSDPFGPIPEEGIAGARPAWPQQLPGEGDRQKQKMPATEDPLDTSVTADLLADFEADQSPAPALPSRTATDEVPPEKPPRPQAGTARQGAASPTTAMKTQRNQTYQIKKVRWFDDRVRETRVSPVLVQNANGPCPLLALVNALTLSTPRELDTGLVETLRSREQVSLGLLLDAVFEELMSGRRGDSAQELPDVGELYSFLIALHTGMNVNPQFTRPEGSTTQQKQAGAFEQTKEMRLYGTFSVPLMHGWIPEPNSEAYAAFERSAKTYEDAQNIQFYEEELEGKFSTTGLSTEEQHMFEDLVSIKQFLTTWPTQLTEYGLAVIQEQLRPGEFAILFRNDHFSTVYKQPRSNTLLTVVTDAGYASHEEIVWESLVDINGMRTEHFSGDFRPVSHGAPSQAERGPTVGARHSSLPSAQNVQSMLDGDQGWTQVQGKKGKRVKTLDTTSNSGQQQTGVIGASSAAGSSSAAAQEDATSPADRTRVEQEDADLALALQLQEEEEERQRREQTDRRTRQLSSQVLDQPGAPPTPLRPLVPPRRGPAFTTNRPTDAGDEAPPPSYEDASKDRRFNPPRDHPASPHAPITPVGASSSGTIGGSSGPSGVPHQRQPSAYMQNARRHSGSLSTSNLPATAGGPSRRPTHPVPRPSLIDRIPDQVQQRLQQHGAGYRGPGRLSGPMPGSVGGPGGGRDEKCVVM